MSSSTTAWIQIHCCVFLWGFTAVLGRLIELTALPLVLWRMLLVTAALLLWPQVWRSIANVRGQLRFAYAGAGALVALHWLTFYASVKLANASVTATCMALVPAFISVIEPWLLRRPFERTELALGILVLPGVALVVGGTPDGMNVGIALGIASALLVALFSSLNKRMIGGAPPLAITALEMGSGAMCLVALSLVVSLSGVRDGIDATGDSVLAQLTDPAALQRLPAGRDLVLLPVLAFGCTLVPFSLSLVALRHLSAYASALAVNLEPVYAILLASLVLAEQRELEPTFYAGAAILLGVVLLFPALHMRRGRR